MKNQRYWTVSQESNGRTITYHGIFEEQTRPQVQTHAGLWLDKYVREEPLSLAGQDPIQPRPLLVSEVANLPVPASYSGFYANWKRTLKDYGARTKLAQTKGRMVVYLGAESVIETSVALHHTYGTPYIPGSSLKGLAASYLRLKLRLTRQEKELDSQDYKELARAYQILFGDQDEAGYIVFFDAPYCPESASEQGQERPLHADVMTVHHPEYYKGKQAPNDRQSPVPIPFLSAIGYYLLALAAPDLDNKNTWINFTFQILAQALHEQGIGAKTSSGYGRMELVDSDDALLSEQGKTIKQLIQSMDRVKVNQQIYDAYKEWKTLKTDDDKRIIAKGIIEKIEQTGYTQLKQKKDWYIELVTYIG